MDFIGVQNHCLQTLERLQPTLKDMLSHQQELSTDLQRQALFNPDTEALLTDSLVREDVLVRLGAISATQDLNCHVLEVLNA
jgi:hypothetical protein